MSRLRLCEVDDADGVDAADAAVVDDKEADGDISIIAINGNVSNSVIINMSTIRSINITIRMIVNHWQQVA